MNKNILTTCKWTAVSTRKNISYSEASVNNLLDLRGIFREHLKFLELFIMILVLTLI